MRENIPMAPAPNTPIAKYKMKKVMHEFKTGSLKSSSGDKVTSRNQAIAIGISEGKRASEGKAKKASKRGR